MEHKMKTGLLVDSLRLGTFEGIRKAAELGVRGIQIYAVSGEMSPDRLGLSRRKELLDRIRSCGLVVSAVCGDPGGHGFVSKESNTARIEQSKRIMELARDLESDVVTTHIGVIPEMENEQRVILSDSCYRLGTIASEMDAVFAIETGSEKAITLRKFLDDLHCKGIGVNFDPANLVMVADDDPVKGVHELSPYIVHTHVKDGIMIKKGSPEEIYSAFADPENSLLDFNDYFKETPLGEGSVDFEHYFQALAEIGYTGFLTIEREVGDHPVEDIERAVGYLNEVLRQNQFL